MSNVSFARCRNILLSAWLLSAGFVPSAYGQQNFALPESKAYLHSCVDAVLQLHPGQIEQFSFYRHSVKSYFDFVVRTREGTRWVVLCDSTNGRIVDLPGSQGRK